MSKHIIATVLLQELINLVENSSHAQRTVRQVNEFLQTVTQSIVPFVEKEETPLKKPVKN